MVLGLKHALLCRALYACERSWGRERPRKQSCECPVPHLAPLVSALDYYNGHSDSGQPGMAMDNQPYYLVFMLPMQASNS